MKVALVDYSGDPYGAGLAEGLSHSLKKLYYITSKNSVEKNGNYTLLYTFQGGKAKNRFLKITKGIRYLFSYFIVYFLAVFNRIDTVHIIWSPLINLDIKIVKRLKKTGKRLVLTPHNVLPHSNTTSECIEKYRQLYSCYDKIILHGDAIKKEFFMYFPELIEKIVIEPHGTYVGLTTETDISQIDDGLLKKIKNSPKTCIFFGNMFYNKGVDYLIENWIKRYADSEYLLIVVGHVNDDYIEIKELTDRITATKSIYFIPESISEILLNTLIKMSDFIVMPYRHATMSGVIFKAAELNKTILTTDTGAIGEYLNESCSFVCTDLKAFMLQLDEVLRNVSKQELITMGEALSRKIVQDYNWDRIAEDTIFNAY